MRNHDIGEPIHCVPEYVHPLCSLAFEFLVLLGNALGLLGEIRVLPRESEVQRGERIHMGSHGIRAF